MSVESTLKAVLEADATLLALATGGVWSWDETGEKGLSRTLTPAAFDSFGVIKPCVMVGARAANPDPSIADDTGQIVATRQVVECYIMADSGYSTHESIANRIYTLLQAKMISGAGRVDWAGSIRMGRDLDLNANVLRDDWLTVRIRSGS